MDTLTTPPNPVNSTPEAAVSWIESKVRSHELGANSGRLWSVAINALAALRRDDEPKDSVSMIEMIPELERRWCIANDDARGATAKTYSSRARAGLKANLRFLEDPSGFKFDARPRADAGAAPARKKERRQEPAAAAPPRAWGAIREFASSSLLLL